MREVSDYLPISFLNQFVYCPRRFWLMYVQKEWEVNAAVLEGTLRHQNAHQRGTQTDENGRTLRSLYLWSDRLRIAGIADFVQERDGALIPLEHKRGRMGKWLNDHIQVCAQALCLEERMGIEVPHGEIFYWGNRRRERVVLDEALRASTKAVIGRMYALLEAEQLPAPIDHPAKCADCSLEPVCLPRETLQLLSEDVV
jgi:CRISPR-associated exonuclease Cas4